MFLIKWFLIKKTCICLVFVFADEDLIRVTITISLAWFLEMSGIWHCGTAKCKVESQNLRALLETFLQIFGRRLAKLNKINRVAKFLT